MGRLGIRKPSPAMVVASLALFVALGGVSYAAVELGKNDVKSSHIKNGAVKPQDLQDGILGGVQTGVVDAGGTSTSNPAATVTRPSTGNYTITFRPGTWTGQGRPLVLNVTPFGDNGAVVAPTVLGGQRRADGSAVFTVRLSSTLPAVTPHDNAFFFSASTSG